MWFLRRLAGRPYLNGYRPVWFGGLSLLLQSIRCCRRNSLLALLLWCRYQQCWIGGLSGDRLSFVCMNLHFHCQWCRHGPWLSTHKWIIVIGEMLWPCDFPWCAMLLVVSHLRAPPSGWVCCKAKFHSWRQRPSAPTISILILHQAAVEGDQNQKWAAGPHKSKTT